MIEPRWLSVGEVVHLHAMQVAEFGGSAHIRDYALLESAVIRPRLRYHYGELQTLPDLAMSYASALNANHPFVDGNKRVGFFALLVFLRLHGLILNAPAAEATEMILSLAGGCSLERDLSRWVRCHVQPAKPPVSSARAREK